MVMNVGVASSVGGVSSRGTRVLVGRMTRGVCVGGSSGSKVGDGVLVGSGSNVGDGVTVGASVGSGVTVGTGVSVGMSVAVLVGGGVGDAVSVAVAVIVGVFDGVLEMVGVSVGVFVIVGVLVVVGVFVAVGVRVFVGDADGVAVMVGVSDGARVGSGASVGSCTMAVGGIRVVVGVADGASVGVTSRSGTVSVQAENKSATPAYSKSALFRFGKCIGCRRSHKQHPYYMPRTDFSDGNLRCLACFAVFLDDGECLVACIGRLMTYLQRTCHKVDVVLDQAGLRAINHNHR